MLSKIVTGALVATVAVGAAVTPALADSAGLTPAALTAPAPAAAPAPVAAAPAAVTEAAQQAAAQAAAAKLAAQKAAAAKAAAAKAAAAKAAAAKKLAAQRKAAALRAQRLARIHDMTGVMPSLYTGKYYNARYEKIRRCIVKRESMGYYAVVNRRSGAAGAYQFLRGTSNYVARKMGRNDLVGKSANRWNRLEQDQAFWTLWNNGKGRGHWAGGRYHC